jgi:hypothetical protein
MTDRYLSVRAGYAPTGYCSRADVRTNMLICYSLACKVSKLDQYAFHRKVRFRSLDKITTSITLEE